MSLSFFVLFGVVAATEVLVVLRGEPLGEYRSVLAVDNVYTFRVVWGVLPAAFLLFPFSHTPDILLLLLIVRGDPWWLLDPLPPLLFLCRVLLCAPLGEHPMDEPPGEDPELLCGELRGDEPAPDLALK